MSYHHTTSDCCRTHLRCALARREAGAATPFQAIKDANNPYVGAWYLPEGDGFNVLTILDDSHYVIAHNTNGESYTGEDVVAVSSEWGNYSLSMGIFEVASVETETDGPGGLYDFSSGGLTASSTVTGYGDLQFEIAIGDAFSLQRVGRFSVELTDLAGNTSSILVERTGGVFANGTDKSFEFDLVGEDDTVQVDLQANSTGSVTYSDGYSVIDEWSVNAGGTLSYLETNIEDSSTGYWVFAPIKTADGEWALVDFRHSDGSTESLLGFYVSELRPL